MLLVNNTDFTEILTTGGLIRSNKRINFLRIDSFEDNKSTIILNDIEFTEHVSTNATVIVPYSISIRNVTTKFDFSIGCTVIGALWFEGGDFTNITIGGAIKGHVMLINGTTQDISFVNVQFEQMHIYGFKAKFLDVSSTICQEFSLAGGTFDTVRIGYMQSEFKNFRITGGNFKHFFLAHSKIDYLLVRMVIPTGTYMALESLQINKLYIAGTTNFGKISINQLDPFGIDSYFEISSSILGNLDIISTDLSLFKLCIHNSKLVDIFYTDTTFAFTIQTKGVDKLENQKKLIGIYEQLSVVASKRGDKRNMLYFQAHSLENILKTVRKGSLEWWMLYIYKISNNFRLSWFRGVLFTLTAGLIFFIPFALLIEDGLEWGLYGWRSMWGGVFYFAGKWVGPFFEFLNPLHKIDYFVVTKSKLSPLAYVIDYVGRIFIGFGIYQTVQAFRKYGKSGE